MSRRFVVGVVAVMLVLAGCGPKVDEYAQICPGKSDVLHSISALRLQADDAVSVTANGRCSLRLYVEGKSKPQKEKFAVKLWFSPPYRLRVQGNIALDPRAIVLGSNEEEFWLAIRPKEISSYVWGKWAEQENLDKLGVRPDILLEALGVVSAGSYAQMQYWSLTNEGAFDVLTKRNDEGAIVKKVYIYSCDYRVARIEYYDEEEDRAVVVAKLGKHKKVAGEFLVPSDIKITTYGENGKENSVTLTLGSPKPKEFTEQQQRGLFERRPPRGFKNVSVIVGGQLVEQYE